MGWDAYTNGYCIFGVWGWTLFVLLRWLVGLKKHEPTSTARGPLTVLSGSFSTGTVSRLGLSRVYCSYISFSIKMALDPISALRYTDTPAGKYHPNDEFSIPMIVHKSLECSWWIFVATISFSNKNSNFPKIIK